MDIVGMQNVVELPTTSVANKHIGFSDCLMSEGELEADYNHEFERGLQSDIGYYGGKFVKIGPQGIGNAKTINHLKKIIKQHKVFIAVLLEPFLNVSHI
ncbi:hypothetical protein GIB67_039380, partial [Kingdonia uniflora]